MLANLRAHTDAVITALESAAAGTTLLVGDAQKPAAAGWQGSPGQSDFVPYIVVYPWGGFTFDGHLARADDNATLEWQLTCVGQTREQCEAVQDVAFTLIGNPLTVVDRFVPRVRLGSAGGGVRPDETVQPTVWVATPQLAAWSTPSGV